MATCDLMTSIKPVVAIAPAVVTDGTAQVSDAIDTQGFESATFVIALGTLADADAVWGVTIKHGDTATQGDHTAVDDADLIGTEALAGFTFAADGATRMIGYSGSKRYISIEIDDTTANTGNAPMAAIAILGHAQVQPTDNPPA